MPAGLQLARIRPAQFDCPMNSWTRSITGQTQQDEQPSRSEAIRRLVELGLKAKGK